MAATSTEAAAPRPLGRCRHVDAYQKLNRLDDARSDIDTALLLEPANINFVYHLFNLLIQTNLDFEIGPRINNVFCKLSPDDRVSMIGYIEKCIETGLIHKNQLAVEIATAVLKVRNSRE